MKRVGFKRGARWVFDGADLLGRAPGPLAGVAALVLLVSLVQVIHPVYGPAILLLVGPMLTAGVLTAFHLVSRDKRPTPTVLFTGWQNPRTRVPLLLLGLWVLLGLIAVVMVTAAWIGVGTTPEQLEALMQSPEALYEFIAARNVWALILPVGLIIAAVLSALFFAVPQVMFLHARPFNALWLSLHACLRNWAALLTFGLAALGVGMVAGLLAGFLASLLSLALGEMGQWVAQVPVLIIMLIYQLILTGAQYRAFVEIFGLPGTDEKTPDGNDNQFVA